MVWGKRASRATVCAYVSKFTQQAGGRGHDGRGARLRDPFFQPPLFSPELPSALAPIICPNGRARGPNEPFGTERKEGANCSCDVGVVVPFNAFAMATGQRPWKHAAPLSGQRPKGREAAVNFSHMIPACGFMAQKIIPNYAASYA